MESLEPTLVLKLCQINKDDPGQYNYLQAMSFLSPISNHPLLISMGKGSFSKMTLKRNLCPLEESSLGLCFLKSTSITKSNQLKRNSSKFPLKQLSKAISFRT